MMDGIEAETAEELLRYLRHEAGHAFSYVHRPYETEEFGRMCGDYSRPYREDYVPQPFTRDYAILLQEQLATAGITVSLEELTSEAFYAGGPQETPWLNSAVTLVPWTTRTTPTQFVVPMVRTIFPC